ncbi:hypothetical protein [Cellulosimicrobium cellulans]|uniref:hypothetical protein n=1 Tax=Cellulosimicrobium cellulans TaxID=1710 RepID=UPI001112EE34|nr:hypothetical protein [Cellulosimicrobium cellulans]
MSDAGAGWQDPGVRGVLAGVSRMPSAAREHALAVVGAQHAPELEHDARPHGAVVVVPAGPRVT